MSHERQVVIADSSQIEQFVSCPMLWNYQSQENLVQIIWDKSGEEVDGSNIAMISGSYGHKLLEIYYKSIAKGNKWNTAMDEALAFDYSKDEKFSVLEKPDVALINQRIREYCYTYSKDDVVPVSEETVEVGFSVPILDTESKYYVLEGRIDFIGSKADLGCAMDHKFQFTSKSLYKKSIQFRNYCLVAKKLLMIINYIRLTKGISETTIKREYASFSSIELEIWKQRLIRIFDQMAEIQKTKYFEQRWSSCSGRYGTPCPYTSLCEEWDKELIENIKRGKYRIKEAFKPW